MGNGNILFNLKSENKMSTIKELSKKNWEASGITVEEINAGSLQRIADATELMTGSYIRTQNDLEYYKRKLKESRGREDALIRRITSLKGVITKLKKKIQ